MPVKWDAQKDQFLLLQITAYITLNKEHFDNIIAAWPTETLGEKPTQRAISEHFVKLRQVLGKAGVGNFKANGAKGGKGLKAPSTPSVGNKAAPKSRSTTTKAKGASKLGGKRKRGIDSSEGEAEMTEEDDTPTHARIKTEDGGETAIQMEPIRQSLPRGTKSPEHRKKQAQYVQENFGESSEESDVVAGEEGNYVPETE
ncbi:hypothetical protein C1H76_1819 [Elsinoe australis]|uniref:Uncharacterized protein n=1 Tax=Elsinoe australis TaxID=40998 RepID=A0A4U7B3T2_9PEZI|nr:hypothetical protein C1H76_1819 [Elsinoe australis]